MSSQYRAINHCIQLLRQSKISELKKQQVEFQMVQLKRLLLQEDLPEEVTCGPCSADVLDSLRAEIHRISLGEGKRDAVDDLLTRLHDIRLSTFQTLKEHAKPRRPD